MPKKKVTLVLDEKAYSDFRKYCEENAIMVSKRIEIFIREFLKNSLNNKKAPTPLMKKVSLIFGFMFLITVLNPLIVNAVSTIMIPTAAADYGGDDQIFPSGGTVDVSDGEVVRPYPSEDFYVQITAWNDSIPLDSTVTNVTLYCEVDDIKDKGEQVAFGYNTGSGWTDYACMQPAVELTVFSCDLYSLGVDTATELNNLDTRCEVYDSNHPLGEISVDYTYLEVEHIPDSTPPNITIKHPENITYNYNISLPLNYSIIDNEGNLDSCWYNLDNANNITLLNCQNITFNTSEGSHTLNLYANDTVGNVNLSSVTFSVDTTPPSISSLTETPSDPATYSPGQVYEFNVSITDNAGLDTVLFEFDGVNYTASGNGDVYNVSLVDLAANTGGYSYIWYANDTLGNSNTYSTSYTINKATPLLTISSDPSWSETYGTLTNVSGSGCPSQLTCTLYRNSTGSVSNGVSVMLGAGAYNYAYNTSGNENYTSFTAENVLTIDKAYPVASLTNDTALTRVYNFSVYTHINISESNNGDEDVVYVLWKDGSNVGESDKEGAAGTYNYKINTTGGQNYSAGDNLDPATLTINKALPFFSISVTSPITYGTASNYAGTEINNGDKGCSYILERNGIQIDSGSSVSDSDILGTGNYTYTYLTYGCVNYTFGSQTINLTVNKSIPFAFLTSNFGWNISEGEEVTINVSENNSGDNDVMYKVYRDNIDKGTGETWSPTTGSYNYILNTTGGQNYSAVSIMDAQILSVVDTTLPSVSVAYPENTNYQISLLNLNYTFIETNPDSCWYSTDNGATNSSIQTCGNNWSGLSASEGSNTWTVYMNDTFGNKNSDSVSFFVDSIVPDVNIILPQDGSVYGYNESIALVVSVTDTNRDSCWYNLGGENITIDNCQNTTFDVEGDGSYFLNLYSNDTLGNEKSDNVSFTVQLDSPTITLHFPIDVYLNYQEIEFNYTPLDIELDSCELWFGSEDNFSLNQTNTNVISEQINNFNLSLVDGNYLWNIKCNDSQGNYAFNGNKTFFVDTSAPGITLNEPAGRKTTQTGLPLTFSVLDENLDSCWYNLTYDSGGTWATYHGKEFVKVPNCSSTTFSVSDDYSYILYLMANDSAGNLNRTNSTFFVDTSIPLPVSSGGGGGGGTAVVKKNETEKGELQITKLPDLIVDPGEKKKLVLGVKNVGKTFLNNCKVKGKGKNAAWISAEGTKGLSVGEEYDFLFTLNVPKTLGANRYEIMVWVVCQEVNKSTNFVTEILKKDLSIELISINRESEKEVKITYSLKELTGQDQEFELGIILVENGNKRIAEINKTEFLEANSSKEFEVSLIVPSYIEGDYSLLIYANSATSSAFVQEDIVLGSVSPGGLAILDSGETDIFISILLLLMFAIFSVFVVWRIIKLRKLEKTKKNSGVRRVKSKIKK